MTQPAGPASLRRAGPAFFVLLPTPPTGRPSPALPRRHVAAVRNPGPSQESQSSGNWSHPGSCLLEHASQPAPRRCRPARLTRPRLNHASQRLGSVLSRPPRIPGADNPGVNQSRPPAHPPRPHVLLHDPRKDSPGMSALKERTGVRSIKQTRVHRRACEAGFMTPAGSGGQPPPDG
jgi:hypothetical protein